MINFGSEAACIVNQAFPCCVERADGLPSARTAATPRCCASASRSCSSCASTSTWACFTSPRHELQTRLNRGGCEQEREGEVSRLDADMAAKTEAHGQMQCHFQVRHLRLGWAKAPALAAKVLQRKKVAHLEDHTYPAAPSSRATPTRACDPDGATWPRRSASAASRGCSSSLWRALARRRYLGRWARTLRRPSAAQTWPARERHDAARERHHARGVGYVGTKASSYSRWQQRGRQWAISAAGAGGAQGHGQGRSGRGTWGMHRHRHRDHVTGADRRGRPCWTDRVDLQCLYMCVCVCLGVPLVCENVFYLVSPQSRQICDDTTRHDDTTK